MLLPYKTRTFQEIQHLNFNTHIFYVQYQKRREWFRTFLPVILDFINCYNIEDLNHISFISIRGKDTLIKMSAQGPIILILMVFVSILLTYKILKDADFRRTSNQSKRAIFRTIVGGISGAIIISVFAWFAREPNIYFFIALPLFALIGFWAGSIVGLFSMKMNKKEN